MSRSNRQQSQRLTRERLRSAAVREFAQRGVSAASIDRIAEAAGFSRGAFYSNYDSKRSLLLELVTENQVAEIEFWQASIDRAEDIETLFLELETRFNAFVARGDWGILGVEFQLEAERDPEFGRIYRDHSAALATRVTDMVRSLYRKAGRDDADADTTTLALHALSLGLTLLNSHSQLLKDRSPGAVLVGLLRGVLGVTT